MAEKSLKVQFRQRRAKASYWSDNDIVPGAGEIIIYLPDKTQSDISFKIGDGTNNLSALPMFVTVSGGPAGTTFTPAISSDGILSWTNNGGLENPASVNIKGADGAPGKAGTNGTDGTSAKITGASASVDDTSGTPQVTVTSGGTDSSRTFDFAFTGLKGPKGDKGNDGTGVSIKSSKAECTTVGDAYIGADDGHIYILSSSGTFTDGGEIKGPAGAAGKDGTNATITSATASVDATIGTPKVTVSLGGTASARTFNFAFTGLKGSTGEQGPKGDDGKEGKQGLQGETGATGDGISTITKTSTSGLVDTYTIKFTSGSSTTFTVTNGKNGSDATVEWSSF